jgi:hypothetical protein
MAGGSNSAVGDGGAAGGGGATAATNQGFGLASIADTLNLLVTITTDLQKLDDVTSRSVACEINNVSGNALSFSSSKFSHGGFGTTLPPATIANNATGLFSARSSGAFVGVEGWVTYNIEDGTGESTFTVHFDNPEVGGNSSDCAAFGPIANTYVTQSIAGNGNNGAEMEYIIGKLSPPFSLKLFLQNTKPAGFNPAEATTSIRIFQPSVTSIKSFMKV